MVEASVVILTYGQWALTEQCLRSLHGALGDRLGDSWEIVVVDNDSPDDTRQRLREWSDRVRVELPPANLNFAGGCNAGAQLARGDVLVFLNNDTEVPAGALETLVEQVREPGVAAAGCRLLFPNGTIQHAGVAFLSGEAFGGTAMPQPVFHHQAQELAATRGVFEADSVTAACIAVRRDAFNAAGGFDREYRNGLEDIDLCLRLRAAGETIVYRGDVTLIHHEGASRGTGAALWATPEKLAAMQHNDRVFVTRWARHLEQDDELAAQVWDAELRSREPARSPEATGAVVVCGQPSGVGAAADEARALIVALASLGLPAAAVDLPNPNVVARVSGRSAPALAAALRRAVNAGATQLFVPAGRSDELHHPAGRLVPEAGALLRLGFASTALELGRVARILAASRTVVAQLGDAGVPRSRLALLPPLLEPRAPGAGGNGVLAILPVQDPALTAAILEALRRQTPPASVRLLPTVFDRRLAAAVEAALPGAELLGPCSDEERFAAMAAESDLVLATDPSDLFDRRALTAASVGTQPLTLNRGGAAHDVLGRGVVSAPATLAPRIAELLHEPAARESLQSSVRASCDPSLVGRYIDRLDG